MKTVNEPNAPEEIASEVQTSETQESKAQASGGNVSEGNAPGEKADGEYLDEVYAFWVRLFQDEDVKMDYRLRASDLYHRAMRQKAAADRIDPAAQASREVRPNPYASLTIDELCKLAKHIA